MGCHPVGVLDEYQPRNAFNLGDSDPDSYCSKDTENQVYRLDLQSTESLCGTLLSQWLPQFSGPRRLTEFMHSGVCVLDM